MQSIDKCPFCKVKSDYSPCLDGEEFYSWVKCDWCGAKGSVIFWFGYGEDDITGMEWGDNKAIEVWNEASK